MTRRHFVRAPSLPTSMPPGLAALKNGDYAAWRSERGCSGHLATGVDPQGFAAGTVRALEPDGIEQV